MTKNELEQKIQEKTKELEELKKMYKEETKDKVSISCLSMPVSGGEVVGYNIRPNAVAMLSEWELRLLVAIMADGTFPNKTDDRCILEFKKGRKKDRFECI